MPIRPLDQMTWKEVQDVHDEPWIGLLPIGAVEAHGPHLPLRTDSIIAEAWAEASATRLEARGLRTLIFPTLDYTPAPFAQGFPGTISIAPETLTRLVLDVARSASAQGARALVLCNAHLDPTHLAALKDAVQRGYRVGVPILFPNLTRRIYAVRLTEEFLSGACHAGQYETSIVMAVAPELVRDDIRRKLPPNPSSLLDAIQDGQSTFVEAGGPEAYFGFPADATAAEGTAILGILADIVEDEILSILIPDEPGETP